MRNIILLVLLMFSRNIYATGAMDYVSGCFMGLGGGIAGTALANTKLEKGISIKSEGYAISGVLGCISAIAYVAVSGSNAKFEAEYDLKKENERLSFEIKRLSREKCLLTNRCPLGGRAIIVDSEPEIKKQGDKVYETSTSTLEPND